MKFTMNKFMTYYQMITKYCKYVKAYKKESILTKLAKSI